jgi:hypothetical protein
MGMVAGQQCSGWDPEEPESLRVVVVWAVVRIDA